MRKFKIFTIISRIMESKSPEELASMKICLSMIYAFCGAHAVFYVLARSAREKYPTNAETLKKLYGKEKTVTMDVIKLTGLQKVEVTKSKTINDIELLTDKQTT